MLFLDVNNQEPGAVIPLEKPEETVRVRAEVKSQHPIEYLELLINGQVAASTEKATLDVNLAINKDSWLAARCRGSQPIFDRPANQCLFAHTSPVYMQINLNS